MQEREILMAFEGEMALKGLNRKRFETIVMRNIRQHLSSCGQFKVWAAQSTIYIEPKGEADMPCAFAALQRVFGLAAVSRAAVCEKEMGAIAETAKTYLQEELSAAASFKVEARRSDKTFPLNSMELARDLGQVLLEAYPHLKVDVRRPDVTVIVQIRDVAAYVHSGKKPGAGGLPVSTSGKAAYLLSGGIDSPVAAYLMARRGLALTAVHFASPPYTSDRARQKVESLADRVAAWAGPHALLVVPFTDTQVYLRDQAPAELFTVLMRRSMLRISQRLGARFGCGALITGESLAQVASQTLEAIGCTNAAVEMPVLRPLIGLDKNDIVEVARRIDTFDLSTLPYEDCCTIFAPAHPKTKPKLAAVLKAEERLPRLAQLEEAAALGAERVEATSQNDKGELL